MTRMGFKPIRILFAAAIAAAIVGCGGGTGAPVSSRNAVDGALAGTIADTGAGGEMFLQGGMFGGGMGSMIDLSADQKQQIKAILEKYRPLQRHARDGKRPSREQWAAMRDSMKTMRDSMKNEIAQVLTPAQKALVDQIKTQLKAGVVPDTLVKKRVQRLTSLLTLTPDQQTQAFTILKQEMQQRLAARSKDSAAVRDSTHERGMRMHGKANRGPLGLSQAFQTILTEQQKQILELEKLRVESRVHRMRQ